MMKIRSILLVSAVAYSASGAAEAGTKSFVILGKDLAAGTGAIQDVFGLGVSLPDVGTPSAIAVFTLPNNYKKNSTVELRLRMFGPINCAIKLSASGVLRIRPGAKGSESLGLSIPGSDLVVTSNESNKVLGKTLKLDKSPSGIGEVSGQRPGDQIHAVIFRESGDIGDTCTGSLSITSVKVTYTTE